MIIVIGGIKGGTGKTTIATNLAVINQYMNRKTLLVDADDQGSCTDWSDQREEYFKNANISSSSLLTFPTIALTGKNIHLQINKIKNDYSDIFIDTGGRDTVNQRSSLIIADFFLIPFKPKSFDIWTIGKVKDLYFEIKSINPKLKVVVCINQADSRGSDNEDAIKILSEIPEFKCMATFLGHRKAFSNAASLGLSVIELDKDSKAKDEMFSIYQSLF